MGGVTFAFTTPDGGTGAIMVGVFPTTEAAQLAWKANARFTSVGPRPGPVGSLGDRGYAWWAGKADRHVAFYQDNVCMLVSLDRGGALAIAEKVDTFIREGTNGVARAEALISPQITDIDGPSRLKAGEIGIFRVHVTVPQGANGDRLGICDRFGVDISRNANARLEAQLTYKVRHRATTAKDAPKESLSVVYATARCVMAHKRLELTIVHE